MKFTRGKKPPELVSWVVTSSGGRLVIGWNDKGEICRSCYLKKMKAKDVISRWQQKWRRTEFTNDKLVGDLSEKSLILIGSEFQFQVLKAVLKVSRGKVTSFAKLAQAIGKPTASRAVGAACKNNPLRYLIPCYRVLGSDGSLRDSASGVEVQKNLLKIEGYTPLKSGLINRNPRHVHTAKR